MTNYLKSSPRIAYVLAALFMLFLLAGSSSFSFADAPNYIPCSGQETYSGYVYDQEGAPLAGVVVYLATVRNFQPASNGAGTSDYNGYWSVTLQDQCPHNAYFYWQSDNNGPLLMTVSAIPLSGTTYTVNVWVVPENTQVAYEYPNTQEASIKVSISNSLSLSDNVYVQGGIADGFLGVDAAGQVGTTLTFDTVNSAYGTVPFEAYFSNWNSIKVEDTSGNMMVYKQAYTGVPTLNTASVSEYISMSTALSKGAAYVQIAGNTGVDTKISVSGVVTLDAQVSMTAFGFTLTTEAGVQTGSQQSTEYTINNPNSYTQCFVVYQQGPEIHIWLYSNNPCP